MAVRSGGGRGFGGGFSYRGSRGGGGPRQTVHRTSNKYRKSQCSIDLFILPSQRRLIIGAKGRTIKHLRSILSSDTKIDIPGNRADQRHPVKIRSNSIGDALHACWEISLVLADTIFPLSLRYTIYILNSDVKYEGILQQKHEELDTGLFMLGNENIVNNERMSVYCLEIDTNIVCLDVIVDNLTFVDPSISSFYELVIPKYNVSEKDKGEEAKTKSTPSLVFIFGLKIQKPHILYENLKKITTELWFKESMSNVNRDTKDDVAGEILKDSEFRVGNYTINKGHRTSNTNWSFRYASLIQLLLNSSLDVYFLHEYGLEENSSRDFFSVLKNDQNDNFSSLLSEKYILCVRPESKHVGILLAKSSFDLDRSTISHTFTFPTTRVRDDEKNESESGIISNNSDDGVRVILTFASNKKNGRKYLFACLVPASHPKNNSFDNMELYSDLIIEYLDNFLNEVDTIICGNSIIYDNNKRLKSMFQEKYSCFRRNDPSTPPKKFSGQNIIFWNTGSKIEASHDTTTECFVNETYSCCWLNSTRGLKVYSEALCFSHDVSVDDTTS